ncbi:PREDICTED: uncharacterized protein LOC107083262 [Cyprinodon variegatus]|uniref:uncharacterized protein LOC107083262 n=1 Tax=Cyprinodon variegatus TaxID=28743 RepID=UPI000742CBD9|nr:PREDICTED: uncharacterized protein LOC107083262 [Cyprinodon variegatus]
MRPKGLSLKEEAAPKNDSAPQEYCELQFSPITFYGRKAPGCSNLFLYLQVRELDAEKVIGIDSVWECRGICLDTFFLCESCEKTILCRNIFEHMTNLSHQLEYMRKRHPEFLKIFWLQKDLPQALQMNILREVVRRLAERDRAFKVDAKCIILKQELHQFVRTAQFNEALKIVRNILSEEKTTFHLSSGLAAKAEEKGKRSNLEDSFIVGASAVVKAFSPVKMTSTSLKTNLLDPSAHDPGETLVQFTNPNAFVKREFKSAVSYPQSFGEELVPETSCSAVKNSLSASVGAQTRKRTAEVSLSLHQLKYPTPAKRTFLLQRLKSEPGSPPSMTPPLNSVAPSSSLAMKDEGSSSIKATSTLDQDFLLKPIPGMKWQTSKKNHHSALAKDHITGIKSEIVSRTCDSKSQLIKAEAEMNRAFNSIEGNTVPKPDPDYRKEPLSFGASAATISSPEDFLEGSTVTKVIPLTEVAPSTDLQNLQFFHSQKICRVESYGTSTNHISGQIPDPKGDLESDWTLISQPSSFKDEILNPDKHFFQGSYEGLTTPCFNRNHQIGFNTCPPPAGSCCAEAFEGYNPHSQLSDISHQQCMYPIYPQPVILFSPTVQLLPGVGVFHIPCYSWAARMGR